MYFRKSCLNSAVKMIGKRKLDTQLHGNEENIKISKNTPPTVFIEDYLQIQKDLNSALKDLTFSLPVKYTYNPLEYAWSGNEAYVRHFCRSQKPLLFVGMNPGPFGMCQTGVPFGDVKMVRDWMGIKTEIGRPVPECPTRKITGFGCPRSEVSGHRLWNLFKKLSGTAETFFENAFVFNYCPLAFMKENGTNVTPSEMKMGQVELEKICDESFAKILTLLRPETVIGIGAYAEKRSVTVLKKNPDLKMTVVRLPHPSPRAANNNNWPEKAEKVLHDNNLLTFLKKSNE